MLRRALTLAVIALPPLLLAGCDLFGGESAEALAARKEAEGKAVGGACRHAGRALEDCYALNRKSERAAVFAGWREMNDYMRENKIDSVAPQLGAGTELAAKPAHVDGCEAKAAADEKAAKPAAGKRAANES
jgi:hypothetical protein